jgi:hypothetical protein
MSNEINVSQLANAIAEFIKKHDPIEFSMTEEDVKAALNIFKGDK